MGVRLIRIGEPTQARRRAYFHVVATDGITPVTDQAGGQPQISVDGAAWTNVGIGVLVSIGNGRYYADLVDRTAEAHLETRYKATGTAECPGDSLEYLPYLPGDEMVVGTVQGAPGPTATVFTASANLLATANAYTDAALVFLTGANKGISRRVTGYTAGRVVTVEAFPAAPAAADRFGLVGVIE